MKKEKIALFSMSGWVTLIFSLTLFFWCGFQAYQELSTSDFELERDWSWGFFFKILFFGVIIPITICSGNITLKPNEAAVFTFMGNYMGTLKKTGYYWVPFWWSLHSKRDMSIQQVKVAELKVNDAHGNPILISCEIYCKEEDTYAATFEISELGDYLESKGEVALRSLAMKYPMDTVGENEVSLRGSAETILKELQNEVTEQFKVAGYKVEGAGITTLNYAPEIAAMMLQRQQAQAMIDSRSTLAKGAVGIIKETFEQLKKDSLLKQDSDITGMVSNMLVTLCSSQHVSPVLEVQSKPAQ